MPVSRFSAESLSVWLLSRLSSPLRGMSTLRQTGEQSRCRHVKVTYSGSNRHQTRVTCAACNQTLMLLYHNLETCHVDEALRRRQQARGERPPAPTACSQVSGAVGARCRSPSCPATVSSNPSVLLVQQWPRPLQMHDGNPPVSPPCRDLPSLEELPELQGQACLLLPSAPALCLQCLQKPSWNGMPGEYCSVKCRDKSQAASSSC